MVIFISVTIFVACIIWLLTRRKQKGVKLTQIDLKTSDFAYSAFRSPINENPRSLILISEGNRIDELGYLIYKSYIADLDKIDILIRDNKTGEIMQIVKNGDSESMIGVSHPEKGHIGYLGFEYLNIVNFSELSKRQDENRRTNYISGSYRSAQQKTH